MKYLAYTALFLIVGVIILLGIPSTFEGPLIIALSDEHAIRFVDAVRLAFILAGNFLLFKILHAHFRKNSINSRRAQNPKLN